MKLYRFDSLLPEIQTVEKGRTLACVMVDELPQVLEGADLANTQQLVPECGAFCFAESRPDCIAGELCIPDLTGQDQHDRDACFFIDEDIMVFVDTDGLVDDCIGQMRKTYRDVGSSREHFLYNLISVLVKGHLSTLETIEHSIMELEEKVADEQVEDFSEQITPIRKRLSSFRELYEELGDMLEELIENENGFLKSEHLNEFELLLHRVERLQSRVTALLDSVSQVRESYREMTAEKTNETMNRLTVISAIFLPLTLITGWFGMNFINMPELAHGYPYVAGGSVLLVLALLWYLRKKRLL